MGYPYNELVAPAVLWMNPGVTREELVELLDQTHSSGGFGIGEERPWDYVGKCEDDSYHNGLTGLARKLYLCDSGEYEKFKEPSSDEHGLLIRPPCFLGFSEEKKRFEVVVHERNVFGAPKRIVERSMKGLSIGDFVDWQGMASVEEGLISKIFEERYLWARNEDNPTDSLMSGLKFEYDLEVRPFYDEGRREEFETEDELYSKWPQFHPDFRFDWGSSKGSFMVLLGRNRFFWEQRDGKYYFDPKSFEVMPAGFNSGGWGYTDLLLTAFAIRKKAWKILSYRGLDHFDSFVRDFPDVKETYRRAVLDSHTSLYAKRRGMSVKEFLRFRLLGLKLP